MVKKKLLAMVTVAVTVMSLLTGCSGNGSKATSGSETASNTQKDSTASNGEGSNGEFSYPLTTGKSLTYGLV